MFRMGILSCLRSKVMNGSTIGVMITASHNPEEDNGVKLIDPFGDMLKVSWEEYATNLANASNEKLWDVLNDIIAAEKVDLSQTAKVALAYDTRPSSRGLSQAVADGVSAMNSQHIDFGILTTPQLHYMVRCLNTNNKYGEANVDGYFKKLSGVFCKLHRNTGASGDYQPRICVDGANGVGAIQLKALLPYLSASTLRVDILNDGTHGKLNNLAGADYVKVQQKAPDGIHFEAGLRYCSFDGDADRIVYFYQDTSGHFRLLDGDKIATLFASYLQELVTQSGLELKLGLVQTAYANGSSTQYITSILNVPVVCTPTGVKHLHHRAQDFDVGIYFEANGHGTVLFSEAAMTKIASAKSSNTLSSEQQKAVDDLALTVDVINQTVGDAISDMLLVEIILSRRGWSAACWNEMYTDLPNRQLKVKVKDRTVITTGDAERRVVSPDGLQSSIDACVANYTNARSFVRPSGTEDVVRVYAEANTQANADLLAHDVSCLVFDQAGGVGDRPSSTH